MKGPYCPNQSEELHIDDPEYYNELNGSATRKETSMIWVNLASTPVLKCMKSGSAD